MVGLALGVAASPRARCRLGGHGSLSAAILLIAYGGTVLDNASYPGRAPRALAVRNLLGGLLGAALQVAVPC